MNWRLAIIVEHGVQAGAGGKMRWPKTLEDTVITMVSKMSETDRQRLSAVKQADLIQFHPGWGTSIRNTMGHWQGNEKHIRSARGKLHHSDDASISLMRPGASCVNALSRPGAEDDSAESA